MLKFFVNINLSHLFVSFWSLILDPWSLIQWSSDPWYSFSGKPSKGLNHFCECTHKWRSFFYEIFIGRIISAEGMVCIVFIGHVTRWTQVHRRILEIQAVPTDPKNWVLLACMAEDAFMFYTLEIERKITKLPMAC